MSFLEKVSDYEYIINLYVKPNSRSVKLKEDGDFLKITLKSKAKRNKANKELLKLLKDKLSISTTQIEFISGATSQTKMLRIYFNREIEQNQITKLLFS